MLRALILAITVLFFPNWAFSGTLKGQVIYSGEDTFAAALKTGKYRKVCGKEIPNEKLIVKNQKLKNVVVYLQGENLGGEPGSFVLDQNKCRYEPHVIAMMKGSELVIRSSDPLNHNIHTYSFENDPINVMFTPGAPDFNQEFYEPEIIKVECDLHGWMTAWIVVTDNSFHSVSDETGSFEIPEVPPGKYTLTAWHETLGSISREVQVGEGETSIDFDFTGTAPQVSQR
ncbi:hypothetical protein GWN75_31865 [candidate division KSB1 bacterium]|nr:hypothetical protein [candidate division KSB1 bacterium]NIS28300.1 hypothetical protein [candidate division KSB1 bacterium]NIU29007.1 hypothetical protein [candidate division KSB1 bacterium]NIW22899.1 hypothetical protein [candidate division KSB1 bacterium]NIW73488.1 hypothetical protein [candidate division KSB1 bacterium]